MFWVYVLQSEQTGRLYTGLCEDFDDRLRRHSAGESRATKHGVPWQAVHREPRPTRADAIRREKYLKTGKGREELKKLLEAILAR